MPYYEYECRNCGKSFTDKQSFEEHDQHKKMKCPKCGSEKVEQLVGSFSIKTPRKS